MIEEIGRQCCHGGITFCTASLPQFSRSFLLIIRYYLYQSGTIVFMGKEGKRSTKVSSNWELLLRKNGVKWPPRGASLGGVKSAQNESESVTTTSVNHQVILRKAKDYVALDCEMVGLGPSGKQKCTCPRLSR